MQESLITQEYNPEEILNYVNANRGMLCERIESFQQQLSSYEEAMVHKCGTAQSEEMKATYPLKQTLEGGLYTREIFMPKGHIIVSMIHRQQHPSFLLKGKVSYLTDSGELVTVEAPLHKVGKEVYGLRSSMMGDRFQVVDPDNYAPDLFYVCAMRGFDPCDPVDYIVLGQRLDGQRTSYLVENPSTHFYRNGGGQGLDYVE